MDVVAEAVPEVTKENTESVAAAAESASNNEKAKALKRVPEIVKIDVPKIETELDYINMRKDVNERVEQAKLEPEECTNDTCQRE